MNQKYVSACVIYVVCVWVYIWNIGEKSLFLDSPIELATYTCLCRWFSADKVFETQQNWSQF